MEKKIFEFSTPKDIVRKVGDLEITVKPFLSLGEMVGLINQYVETYFSPTSKSIEKDEYGYLDAEYAMRLAILDLCTNLIVDSGAFENLFYDELIWFTVRDSISNYAMFSEFLDGTIKNIKEQDIAKNSLASLVEKVGVLLNDLTEGLKDLTPEKLEKLKEAGKDLVAQINESSVAKEVFSDTERDK
jgi:hypothetical protein